MVLAQWPRAGRPALPDRPTTSGHTGPPSQRNTAAMASPIGYLIHPDPQPASDSVIAAPAHPGHPVHPGHSAHPLHPAPGSGSPLADTPGFSVPSHGPASAPPQLTRPGPEHPSASTPPGNHAQSQSLYQCADCLRKFPLPCHCRISASPSPATDRHWPNQDATLAPSTSRYGTQTSSRHCPDFAFSSCSSFLGGRFHNRYFVDADQDGDIIRGTLQRTRLASALRATWVSCY